MTERMNFSLLEFHTKVSSERVRHFSATASFWHSCLKAVEMQKQPNDSAVIGCVRPNFANPMQIFKDFPIETFY